MRQRLALLLAPDLRAVARVINDADEALTAGDVERARRHLAEAYTALTGRPL